MLSLERFCHLIVSKLDSPILLASAQGSAHGSFAGAPVARISPVRGQE